MTPGDQLFKMCLLAFGQYLYSPIWTIAHPTSETQLSGTISCGRAEIYPLDSTAHDHVNPLEHRHGFYLEFAPGARAGCWTQLQAWNAHAEHGTTMAVTDEGFPGGGVCPAPTSMR